MSGISLADGGTLGDDVEDATHIWSFSGMQFPVIPYCPCDGGADSVSYDYFCAKEDIFSTGGVASTVEFFTMTWDGKGCLETSPVDSRVDSPYFI